MAEPCAICGTTEAETYRFCSARRDFVCLSCEEWCQHYSREMLPNGSHCGLKFPPGKKFKYLVIEADAVKFKEKYVGKTKEELNSIYKFLIERHNKATEPEARAELRNRLAAIELILEEYA